MSIKGFKLADGLVVKYDYSALENIDIDDTLSREGIAADASAVGDEITDLKEDLDQIDTALGTVEPTNKFNPNTVIREKQLYNNGNIYDNANYFVSDWIPTNGGDVFYFCHKNDNGTYISNANVGHLCQYDSSKTLIISDNYVNTKTLESNCAYIRVDNSLSQLDAEGAVLSVTFNTAPTTRDEITEWFEPYIYLTADRYDTHVDEFEDFKGEVAVLVEQVETDISTLYDMGTPSTYNNDKVPYLFRPSGGGKYIGGIEKDTIVGGTVAWNQLIKNGNFVDTSNWTGSSATISASNNVLTVKIGGEWNNDARQSLTTVAGHKYLVSADVKGDAILAGQLSVDIGQTGTTTNATVQGSKLTTSFATLCGIINPSITADTVGATIHQRGRGYTGKEYYLKNFNLFDLTLMFGSTIADYIYSLEQSTAGSGVAKLKSWGFFTDSYYPYDSGSLKSVEGLTSHDMVGFNQWDEEWEVGAYGNSGEKTSGVAVRNANRMSVFPNTSYFLTSSTNCYIYLYDMSGNFIRWITVVPNHAFTTGSNVGYINVNTVSAYGTTYKNDICINISNASKNGQYEPYEKHSYALDSDLTLRGIPKLDSSNQLYYDGDIYKADGSVTRKYKNLLLTGQETWGFYRSDGTGTYNSFACFPFGSDTPKKAWASGDAVISIGYPISGNSVYNKTGLGFAIDSNSMLIICTDKANTVDSFKTFVASNNIELVYALNASTTETATPYQTPQLVDKYGTEEYVTDSIVPVGHDTEYYLDANSVLTPPPTAGTYSLKVTVASDGSKSYSWVSD